MSVSTFTLQTLKHFLKIFTYQWATDGFDIFKRGFTALKNFKALGQLSHPAFEEGRGCSSVNNPSFHRPDPCIYSQEFLLKLGLAVTWDNPDIAITKGGVVVSETDLEPDTDYEIDATIWNNSYDSPVVGLKVIFTFLSFGVGTTVNPIGTTFVNLGVKGGVNHPALAKMPWHTPATPGHFCIKVTLVWIDDLNQANNVGQNNVDVKAPHSPATYDFQLRNDTDRGHAYRFEVDTYVLPNPQQCPATIPREDRAPRADRLLRIRAQHSRANFPVPPGWHVTITPNEALLAPNDEITVHVAIEPPAGFTGSQPFNVNALYDQTHAGGVSLVVSSV